MQQTSNSEPGRHVAEHHYAIIEQSTISQHQRTWWEHSRLPRQPLMHQPAFAALQEEGPWLVALDDDVASAIAQLQADLGRQAIQGWLSSHLPLEELSRHLGDTLVAQTAEGQALLLRSYSAKALPALHAREDCAWHASLFGPINNWWLPGSDNDVQRYPGGNLATLPEHTPITLDAPLMAALALDQQALALLDELQRSAPQVFSSTCHGERLAQVESLLEQAKAAGLRHKDDHSVYAALTLLEGISPDTQDSWHEVLWMINEEQHTLGQALELVRSLETP